MNTPNPLPYDKFKEIYSLVPRLAIEVVILKDESILLTKRSSHGWAGMWHTPGGTVLYREAMQDAVKRIALEELGVKVKINKQLGYFEAWSEEKERGFGYSVSLPFLVIPEHLEFQLNNHATEFKFFSDLPDNIVPEHKHFYENINFKSL